MKLTRTVLPPAIAAALLLTTVACSSAPSDSTGAECLAPGSASDSIAVSGETGTDLELTSATPIEATTMERSVLKDGEGDRIEEGQNVGVAMSMFNGADGASLQQFPESFVQLMPEQLTEWAYEGIRCAVSGEQVALVAGYAELFGDVAADQLGLEGVTEEDSFVIVMEFGEIVDGEASTEPGTLEPSDLLKKAEGKAQSAPDGFPTVELDADGAPTITMPDGVEPPTQLEIATLIEGDGETVEPGDRVYVNYRGVIWRTGEEFDSSWSRGEPIDFLTTQVIGGFQQALEGQKVGSQIISVVPADDGGYGAAQLESMGHQPDDVMVFVLDILGTVHAQ
ncbi:MAG: FKBP-type peptidyl-prolyl cis-trans isomerase [Leucobacter sp.]